MSEITREQALEKQSKEELIATVLEAENNLAEATIEFEAVVSELKAAGATAASEPKSTVITVGKKKYQVTAPKFNHEGTVYNAKELAKLPEVVESLLAVDGQTILVELTK